VFEDTAEPGRFLKTFLVETWLELLRQHERVTNADQLIEDKVHTFFAAHLIRPVDCRGTGHPRPCFISVQG
jgi:hypothetical protein